MSYEELAQMIEQIGLPFAYYQFPEGTSKAQPFICFYYPASADEIADSINYVKITEMVIELYTAEKSFELEKRVESVLREHDHVYTRTETWIDDERMYLETYNLEVIINECE